MFHCFIYKDVNRLDRLTSGLLLIATTPQKAAELGRMMRNRNIKKEYVAKVKGQFPKSNSKILTLSWVNTVVDDDQAGDMKEWVSCSAPLIKIEHKIGLCGTSENGKESCTHFRLYSYDPSSDSSILICKPLTGRTHQIRVHLQYMGT